MELYEITLESGGNSGPEFISQRGEKAGVVLSGTLQLWLDEKAYLLAENDSFRFPAAVSHRLAIPVMPRSGSSGSSTPRQYPNRPARPRHCRILEPQSLMRAVVRKTYAGLIPSETKRLRQLENENAKLKRIVADLPLDLIALQAGVFRPPATNLRTQNINLPQLRDEFFRTGLFLVTS